MSNENGSHPNPVYTHWYTHPHYDIKYVKLYTNCSCCSTDASAFGFVRLCVFIQPKADHACGLNCTENQTYIVSYWETDREVHAVQTGRVWADSVKKKRC